MACSSISHILNLSKGAPQSEVHERYRTLSLVFHPDKQQNEQAKEIATQNFLKIQKAYQGQFLYLWCFIESNCLANSSI